LWCLTQVVSLLKSEALASKDIILLREKFNDSMLVLTVSVLISTFLLICNRDYQEGVRERL